MIIGQWLAATIAIDGTSSDAVDLGRDYETLLIYLPTLVSGTVKVQVAEKLGGTYADVYITEVSTGAPVQQISAATTGDFVWVASIGGYRYIKIVSSATQTITARLIRVCGIRS